MEDRFTSQIKTIIGGADSAEKKIRAVTAAVGEFGQQQQKIRHIADGFDSINNKLLKTASLAYMAKKGFDVLMGGIKTSATLMSQENTLKALVGPAAGSALMDYNKAYARRSMFDVTQVNAGSIGFLNYTRDIDQLDRMQQMAERLYAKDPNQGAEGAMFAMKELLSGDVVSARNRYGITGVSGETIRGFMDSGNTGAALDYIDAALNRFGATVEAMEANRDNLLVTWEMFTSNLSADWGEALTNATGKANVFAQTLYDLQQAGDLQPILGAAASAANVLAIGLAWVGENLNWLIPLTGTAAAGLLTYTAVTKGFAIAEKAATVINTAFGATLPIISVGMWPVILAALAGAAALLVLTGAFDKASNAMDNFVGNKVEDLRNIAGVELGKTELPVSIANTEPISVRGEVQIEDQSVKYIYDLAEARRMREYSGITVNVNSRFGDIHRDADTDYILDELVYRAQNELAGAPLGVVY